MTAILPVIDLSTMAAGRSAREVVARQLDDACANAGFFYVLGHGIEPVLLDRLFTVTRQFFDLPIDIKLRCFSPDTYYRGYKPVFAQVPVSPVGSNSTAPPSPDNREQFHVGYDDLQLVQESGEVGPFDAPNIWSDRPADFRAVLMHYHRRMIELSLGIIDLIETGLELRGQELRSLFAHPQALVSLLHYPPARPDASLAEYGIAGHTDYGFLTVLLTDEVGGLEILSEAEAWEPVAVLKGAFICNIGDILQRITNDRYRSTRHRVVSQPNRRRYSIPFFIDPTPSALLTCLPSGLATAPCRYEAVRCSDYLVRRFRRQP
jgi:isopenicillin N synthase-like dioxygenase